MKKGCRDYVGVACVDGTCPKTVKEECEEYSRSAMRCSQCFLNKGCEDCALADTEYCSVRNEEESR
ncbi:hypothetical protein EBB54_12725 [Schaedlerella arabinosiphila]|jgi:hypothetical protein|uniref:Uncharacterized protein n=1 Tax=Schaedlerella arabinosiphila TaxID=2044587 RepID=A0A426DHM9_9FIRM|nr:hypothetical protein EBB54_12725 [Schaedlerella arabinosiphila]